jgi:uncharacterized protein (TIGR01244 family)
MSAPPTPEPPRHGIPQDHRRLHRRPADPRQRHRGHQAAGFKSVICNRPDEEHPGEASTAGEVEAAAKAAGLEFRYIPVISGQITSENVEDQAAALDVMPSPVFAYCRSGARCTNLHGLVQQGR